MRCTGHHRALYEHAHATTGTPRLRCTCHHRCAARARWNRRTRVALRGRSSTCESRRAPRTGPPASRLRRCAPRRRARGTTACERGPRVPGPDSCLGRRNRTEIMGRRSHRSEEPFRRRQTNTDLRFGGGRGPRLNANVRGRATRGAAPQARGRSPSCMRGPGRRHEHGTRTPTRALIHMSENRTNLPPPVRGTWCETAGAIGTSAISNRSGRKVFG